MLEKPLSATDVKSIDNMIYADTDSIKRTIGYDISQEERRYIENDVIATKQFLNSLYGRTFIMNKNYILIHEVDRPIVIFKEHIVSIEKKANGKAEIQTVDCRIFTTDEDYATVVKLIF